MPVTRHRVLLSAVASALTLYAMPTLAFIVPSFPVKLSPAERSAVAALACPGSSGRATSIDASVTTKHAASPEYADVTCGPEYSSGDTPVVARNYCEKRKGRWSCSERTRFVVHVAQGQSTYMAIENDLDISGRLTLVEHLVRLGRYQGFDIGKNVRGAWCTVSNAPRGDLSVRCGIIEMLVINDAQEGTPKYRVYGVSFGPVP